MYHFNNFLFYKPFYSTKKKWNHQKIIFTNYSKMYFKYIFEKLHETHLFWIPFEPFINEYVLRIHNKSILYKSRVGCCFFRYPMKSVLLNWSGDVLFLVFYILAYTFYNYILINKIFTFSGTQMLSTLLHSLLIFFQFRYCIKLTRENQKTRLGDLCMTWKVYKNCRLPISYIIRFWNIHLKIEIRTHSHSLVQNRMHCKNKTITSLGW